MKDLKKKEFLERKHATRRVQSRAHSSRHEKSAKTSLRNSVSKEKDRESILSHQGKRIKPILNPPNPMNSKINFVKLNKLAHKVVMLPVPFGRGSKKHL